jgi:hypothetical protein
MPRSWGREIGGVLQGTATAGGSFKGRPWLKMGCCADDDDDDNETRVSYNEIETQVMGGNTYG